MIDRHSDELIWKQLANGLRQQIESGEITRTLPPERYLRETYKVSASTVSKAMGLLAEEGLIVRLTGLGTFVKDPARYRRTE